MSVDISNLDRDIEIIRKRRGRTSIQTGAEEPSITKIPLESPALMRITSGGIPLGRITRIWGGSSSGKSRCAYLVAKAAQELRGSNFPAGLMVCWHDIEKVYSKEYAGFLGLNIDTLLIRDGDIIEDVARELQLLLHSVHVHILDSVSEAKPQDRLNKDAGDWDVGLKIRVWEKAFEYITNAMDKRENCIVGDTLVAVADGRNAVSIEQLYRDNKDVDVYASDGNKTVIKKMSNISLTRKNAKIVTVVLDDDTMIRCTPDHKFMTYEGDYIEAKNLLKGTSLMRFESDVRNGYREIWMGPRFREGNAASTSWRQQYRLFGKHSYKAKELKGKDLHHKDLDSLNDSYHNIDLISHAAHGKIHGNRGLTPERRKKYTEENWAKYTPLERSEIAKKRDARKTEKQRKDQARKAIESQTAQQLSERAKRGWENGKTFLVRKCEQCDFDFTPTTGGQKRCRECGDYIRNRKYAKNNQRKIINELNRDEIISSGYSIIEILKMTPRKLNKVFNSFDDKIIVNHKVKEVIDNNETQDVYCGTVEDVENFSIITSHYKDKFSTLSGVVIHNCIICIDHASKNFQTKSEKPLGGKEMEHQSSLNLQMKQTKWLYYDDEGLLQTEDKLKEKGIIGIAGTREADGQEIVVNVSKSRVCRPFRKAHLRLDLNTHQFDHTFELMEGAEYFDKQGNVAHRSGQPAIAHRATKQGGWVTLPSGQKIQGERSLRQMIDADKDLADMIRKAMLVGN